MRGVLNATLAIATASGFIGCGSSTPPPAQTPVPTAPAGSVPGAPGVPGGCVPIGQQIPFTLTNAQINMSKLQAGQIPGVGAVGQAIVGGGAAGGYMTGSSYDGSISLNLTSMPGANQVPGQVAPTFGATQSTTVNGNGFLTLSGQAQGYIITAIQNGQIQIPGISANNYNNYGINPFPTVPTTPVNQPAQGQYPTPQNICVSSLAINLWVNGTRLNLGNIWVYLNNSQHGYVLDF